MAIFGGFNPWPLRFGGGKSNIQTIYESINASLGEAYDTSDESNVTAETMAEARAIAAVWSANARLANQWDPNRVTDMLRRVERVFGITPLPTDSDNTRRARLATKFRALGGPLYVVLPDLCKSILGDAFVSVEHITPALAKTHWPGSTPAENDKYSSTVAHILVHVTKPATWTLYEYRARLGALVSALDDFLPAQTTFDWVQDSSHGVMGFYLDDENNLDHEAFD